jgi:ATP-dependent helicase HrpA
MAAELVETTRTYARTVARIDPEWIEPLAGHLVKRTYHDPHWSRRRRSDGLRASHAVRADHRAAAARPYGPIDPIASRELLIRDGLVEGQNAVRAAVPRRNRRWSKSWNIWRPARAAAICTSGSSGNTISTTSGCRPTSAMWRRLERWLRSARCAMAEPCWRCVARTCWATSTRPAAVAEFPDQFAARPGRVAAGVSLRAGQRQRRDHADRAASGLEPVGRRPLGWLVPGLLEEKVLALIRSLPKSDPAQFRAGAGHGAQGGRPVAFGEGPFLDDRGRAPAA